MESEARFRPPTRPVSKLLVPLQTAVHRLRFLALRARARGAITAASPPIVAGGVKVVSPATVTLGHRVSLGRFMYVEVPLSAGDDVLFSGYVAAVGNVHPIDEEGTVFASRLGDAGSVVLDGDNLVGYGAILIAPCHLERGAVVGAGAVVTGRLLADGVYTGVPGRLRRHRRRSG